MFEIQFDNQPERFLKKADSQLQKRLINKINSLAENPVPHDAKVIKERKDKTFRIRVGQYRILYVVFYEDNSILISKIDKREKVY